MEVVGRYLSFLTFLVVPIRQLDRSRSEDRYVDRSSKSVEGEKNKARRTSSARGWTSPSGQRRDWECFSRNADKFERQRWVTVMRYVLDCHCEGWFVEGANDG